MKTRNAYQDTISPSLFARTPKAVFAAIAVSALAHQSGIEFEGMAASTRERLVDEALLAEWQILHQNGIVPQKAPR